MHHLVMGYSVAMCYRVKMRHLLSSLLLLGAPLALADAVVIPGGEYRPPYAKDIAQPQTIKPFKLDTTPVTNLQFFAFVEKSPNWQLKNIPQVFAESNYLKHWQLTSSGYQPLPASNEAPVTHISWFAAQAYCRAQQGRLPTTAEWEWAAQAQQDNSKLYQQKILSWYEKPTPAILPKVGQGSANPFGLFDMHGLIWEWTQDFNADMTSGESRDSGTIDNKFFCGGASTRSADPGDYATFMRFSMRGSLAARYTIANLGFRCAYDLPANNL